MRRPQQGQLRTSHPMVVLTTLTSFYSPPARAFHYVISCTVTCMPYETSSHTDLFCWDTAECSQNTILYSATWYITSPTWWMPCNTWRIEDPRYRKDSVWRETGRLVPLCFLTIQRSSCRIATRMALQQENPKLRVCTSIY
jgi:hypothetical protein